MSARLVVLALAAALAATAPSASAARPKSCRPAGATTIVATPRARVFKWHRLAYGCLFRRNKPYALTSDDGYGTDKLVMKPRLAGPYVGYAMEWEGAAEGYGTTIRRTDLRTGALRIFAEWDSTESGTPDPATMGGLALTPTGSMAWSWDLLYTAKDGTKTTVREVRKWEPGIKLSDDLGGRILDSGPEIDLTSLARDGQIVSWLHGAEQKSITLR